MKRLLLLASVALAPMTAHAQAIFSVGTSGSTLGEVQFFNTTSGSITMEPASGALGSAIATLPANSGTVAELNLAQSWSAGQTFGNGDLILSGSSSGAGTLEAPAAASTYVWTLPAATATLAGLGVAETWTAAQTFTNSDLLLLGSSTGATTLTSANASGTAYTLTVPANTGTILENNITSQTFSGGILLTAYSVGVESSGTYTIVCGNNPIQQLINGGAFTLAPPASDSQCTVHIVNGGSFGTMTFQASAWREGTNTGDTVPTTDRSSATATFTNSSSSITWTQTGIVNDPVYFTSSGTLPTNFTAGTVYYILTDSGTAITVSATPGGSAITAGSAGSGTQTGHLASSYNVTVSRTYGTSHYLVSAEQ